jgi:hypothetical protein
MAGATLSGTPVYVQISMLFKCAKGTIIIVTCILNISL